MSQTSQYLLDYYLPRSSISFRLPQFLYAPRARTLTPFLSFPSALDDTVISPEHLVLNIDLVTKDEL